MCNEKYAGDLMMQKYYRPDHLTKVDFVNRGEVARYFVQDHHEAIVDRRTFDAVQEMMAEHREKERSSRERTEDMRQAARERAKRRYSHGTGC